jgi:hypothetical protein
MPDLAVSRSALTLNSEVLISGTDHVPTSNQTIMTNYTSDSPMDAEVLSVLTFTVRRPSGCWRRYVPDRFEMNPKMPLVS